MFQLFLPSHRNVQ